MSVNLMTYPWPDPTSRRIKQLEAERDSLLRLKVEREAEIVRLEAERDRYRENALDGECWRRCDACECTNIGCAPVDEGYCDAVIKEIDND